MEKVRKPEIKLVLQRSDIIMLGILLEKPMTGRDIYLTAKSRGDPLSEATVYRRLNRMRIRKMGFVRKLHRGKWKRRKWEITKRGIEAERAVRTALAHAASQRGTVVGVRFEPVVLYVKDLAGSQQTLSTLIGAVLRKGKD